MPRKVFVAGEILTAADVNTNLMDQAVMVFDDDAARTSAIPSPSEGMVTYRSDDDVVEVFDGSVFKAVGPGQILQVVSTTLTTAFSSSVPANSSNPITGLSASITPSNSSSKVFVTVTAVGGVNTTGKFGPALTLLRDATALGLGDASGLRRTVTSAAMGPALGDAHNNAYPLMITFLDSPATTSATTYSVSIVNLNNDSQTLRINSSGDDFNATNRPRTSSTITLMEVAG